MDDKIEVKFNSFIQEYCARCIDEAGCKTHIFFDKSPEKALNKLLDSLKEKKVSKLTVDIEVNMDNTDIEEAIESVNDLGEAVKLATKNYEALIKKHKRYLDLAQTPIPYSPCPQITPPYRWHYTVPSSVTAGDRYW